MKNYKPIWAVIIVILIISVIWSIRIMEARNDESLRFEVSPPRPKQFNLIANENASYYFNIVRPYAHTVVINMALYKGIYSTGDTNTNTWIYDFEELSLGVYSSDYYGKIIGQKVILERVAGNFNYKANPTDTAVTYGYSGFTSEKQSPSEFYVYDNQVVFKWNSVGNRVGNSIFWEVEVTPGNYAVFKVISKVYVPEHYAVVVEMTIRIDAPDYYPQYTTGSEEAEIALLSTKTYIESIGISSL